MSIILLINNLNLSDRKFHKSQNMYHNYLIKLSEIGNLRVRICPSLICKEIIHTFLMSSKALNTREAKLYNKHKSRNNQSGIVYDTLSFTLDLII